MPWQQQQQHMQMQQQYGMLPAYQQQSAQRHQQQYMQHPGQMQMQVCHLSVQSIPMTSPKFTRVDFYEHLQHAEHFSRNLRINDAAEGP